jgi:hypothetical protein
MIDYYKVLALRNGASLEEIKNSYRVLALRYHPDRNKSPDATKKFIEITETYEGLCKEKGESIWNLADLLIKPGKVSVGLPNDLSMVEVTQGDSLLHGIIRISQNRQFSIVFRDGFGYNNKWINGMACLIEKDELIWVKEYERPWNAAISDTGRVALIHVTKESTDLGCKLSVIESSGKNIYNYYFSSNVEACAISSDGILVSVATLKPDNSIYCFEPENDILKWKYKNHNKMSVVLGLKFKDTEIEVMTGGSMATMEKDYILKLDGTLTQQYETEAMTLNKIKKLSTKERVVPVLGMITSTDRRQVITGLFELKSLVTTKGSLAHYSKITDTLVNLIQDDELYYSVWEVIRRMLKKDSEAIAPLVPNIINWFRNKTETHDVTAFLSALGELGKANPPWIKNEVEFIKEKLRSKEWNERRYAALALGSIGSVESSFVKDIIPVLVDYASHPELVKKDLENLNKDYSNTGKVATPLGDINFTVISSDDDKHIWIQDACVDALGMIGSTSPDLVKEAIPILGELVKNAQSPYTVKKAKRALELIATVPK